MLFACSPKELLFAFSYIALYIYIAISHLYMLSGYSWASFKKYVFDFHLYFQVEVFKLCLVL